MTTQRETKLQHDQWYDEAISAGDKLADAGVPELKAVNSKRLVASLKNLRAEAAKVPGLEADNAALVDTLRKAADDVDRLSGYTKRAAAVAGRIRSAIIAQPPPSPAQGDETLTQRLRDLKAGEPPIAFSFTRETTPTPPALLVAERLADVARRIASGAHNWMVYDDLDAALAAYDAARAASVPPALVEAVESVLDCPYHLDSATVPSAGVESAPGQVVGVMSMGLLKYRALRAAYDAATRSAPPKESGLAEERGDSLEVLADILDCDMDRAALVSAVTFAHEDAAKYRAAVERLDDIQGAFRASRTDDAGWMVRAGRFFVLGEGAGAMPQSGPEGDKSSTAREDPRAATLEDFRRGVGQRPSLTGEDVRQLADEGLRPHDALEQRLQRHRQATPVPQVPALKAGPEVVWEGDGVRVLADGTWEFVSGGTYQGGFNALTRALAEAKRAPADDLRSYTQLVDAVRSALAQLRANPVGEVADAIDTLSGALTRGPHA
ncbi:hypothetical protein LXT21_43730 [Myxococcus sp. K38C18041901]|uniref:hypothetical protein n=1 Tax=Myxococcus guangdongensis TaxID=2906760 RepID=UPI0020A80DBD|nr:hypothetical protein [Myxococcus guangdongensis]MCP3065701.1 hypothetical protein [Myxococcus guangdongensis]